MEIQKATDFIEEMTEPHFAEKCGNWYEGDTVLVLTETELTELHKALTDWVEKASLIECQCMGRVNEKIRQYLKAPEKRNLEIVLGPNSKQWWVYDIENDVYIDPPKEVLDSLPDYREDYDKSAEAFQKIIDTNPDWLNDNAYWYDAEETDI